MRFPGILVALLSLVAAGCVGTPPEDDVDPTPAAVDESPTQPPTSMPSPSEEEPTEPTPRSQENSTPDAEDTAPRVARYVFNGTTPVVEMWGMIWAEFHPIEVTPNTTHLKLTLDWNGTGDLDPAAIAPSAGGPWWMGALEYQLAPVLGARFVFMNGDGTPTAPDRGAVLEVTTEQIRGLDEACEEDFEEHGACEWHVSAFVKGAVATPYVLTVEITEAPATV